MILQDLHQIHQVTKSYFRNMKKKQTVISTYGIREILLDWCRFSLKRGKSALLKESHPRIHPSFCLPLAMQVLRMNVIVETQYCNIRMHKIGSISTKADIVLFFFPLIKCNPNIIELIRTRFPFLSTCPSVVFQ